jgi:hypothetical protein
MVRIGHLVISEPVIGFKAVLEATISPRSWLCAREKKSYAVRFWVRIKSPKGMDSTFMEFFETIQCTTFDEANDLLDDIEASLSRRFGEADDAEADDADSKATDADDVESKVADDVVTDDEMPPLVSITKTVAKKIDCECGPSNIDFGGRCDGPCGGPCADQRAAKAATSVNSIASSPPELSQEVPDQQACCFSAM